MLVQSLVSSFLQLCLDWSAASVINGLGLVSVVVGLDQEPSLSAELIESVSLVGVSFDDSSLIGANTSNNVVHWSTDNLSLESVDSCGEVGLVLKNSSNEPDSGIGLLGQHADQILAEILCLSGVDVHREGSMTNSSEGEDATSNGVNAVDFLRAVVVLNIDHKFGEELPHLEVQISAVEDLALVVAEDDTGASFEGRELVHKVEEEELVKGKATQLGNCANLSHEILMFELVLGEPLDSVEEALGDWEQVEEVQEPGERLMEVFDDGSPSDLGTVRKLDLVVKWGVALDRPSTWNDGGERQAEEEGNENCVGHDRLLIIRGVRINDRLKKQYQGQQLNLEEQFRTVEVRQPFSTLLMKTS